MSDTLTVFARLSPAKPTPVYDTYWRFAAERQTIFFRKLDGLAPPWTSDPILSLYKFTNTYRASDRVSQFLISKVIYGGDQSPTEVFFRTVLFKIFNRIDTWELFEHNFGQISYRDFRFDLYDAVLCRAKREGRRIFSAAYIMPSGRSAFGYSAKHSNYLKLLERMMKDEVPERMGQMRSMREAFELLRSYPSIGDFLAYQYVIDLNYSEITDFSEMDFVIPGPGALNGIKKCFSNFGGLNESDIIRLVTDRQEQEFARLGLKFQSLGGRRLQLIDCQNLFCEVDKYSRVAHPKIKDVSGRTRIKQKYKPTASTIKYYYPPKWGVDLSSCKEGD